MSKSRFRHWSAIKQSIITFLLVASAACDSQILSETPVNRMVTITSDVEIKRELTPTTSPVSSEPVTRAATPTTQQNSTLEHFELTQESVGGLSIQNIASNRDFYDLAWSPDSKFLISHTWVYNVERGTSLELSLDDPLLKTPVPEITSQIPQEATSTYLSPSGNRVLYLTNLTIIRTTAQPSTTTAETIPQATGAEVWVLEKNSSSQKLGEIEFCGFNRVFWTADEQKVVLARDAAVGNCGQSHAWLVDLQGNTIHPLFSTDVYPIGIRTYAIAPSGQELLYGVPSNENGELGNRLFILNLNTLESIPLSTPQFAHGEQWLTGHKILISFTRETKVHLSLGIFDLNTSELVELTSMFEDACVRLPTVSPNLKWLAFVTGEGMEGCYRLNQLWLMKLDLDE